MLSDFAAAGKRARSAIAVPELPMENIRAQSTVQHKRGKIRTLIVSAAISLAMVGTAAAFGTHIYNGVRLWMSGARSSLSIQSFVLVKEPTASDLRHVVATATFPIVLPLGVPKGAHLWRLEYAPARHPNAVFLEYRDERTHFHAQFALFDSSAIQHGQSPAPSIAAMTQPLEHQYRWRIGRETVLAGKTALTASLAARIKAAMTAATPASSLAATTPVLSNAIVMVVAPGLEDLAVRYAPHRRKSVVVGPRFPAMIAHLARTNKPLLDGHVVDLTNIPAGANGEPDYQKATLRWPHTIAIPASGLRALNAVLHHVHASANCRCLIFFNGKTNAAYSIWLLDLSPQRVLRKYVVNARTLAVTPTTK